MPKKIYHPNKNGLCKEIVKLCNEFPEIPRVAFTFFNISKFNRAKAFQKLIDSNIIAEIKEDRPNRSVYLTKRGKNFLKQDSEEEVDPFLPQKWRTSVRMERNRDAGLIGTFLDSIGIRVCIEDKVSFSDLPICTSEMIAAYLQNPSVNAFCHAENNGMGQTHYLVERSAIQKANNNISLGMTTRSDADKNNRLFRKTEFLYTGTYYQAAEIKNTNINQLKYSKTNGLLMSSTEEFMIYHFDKSLNWYETVESGFSTCLRVELVKMNLKSVYDNKIKNAIFFISDMKRFIDYITGKQKTRFKYSREFSLLTTCFDRVLCIPLDANGQFLTALLMTPDVTDRLHDVYAVKNSPIPTHVLVDSDLQLINRINLKECDANVICLDWQVPYLKQMFAPTIPINYIPLTNAQAQAAIANL